MIYLFPLGNLILQFLLVLFLVGFGLVVFGTILLKFELFLDVVEIVLIHVGEKILGLLLFMADHFCGVRFDFTL